MAAAKLFDPQSDRPFALSRTKVELFLDCPRLPAQRLPVGTTLSIEPRAERALRAALLPLHRDESRAAEHGPACGRVPLEQLRVHQLQQTQCLEFPAITLPLMGRIGLFPFLAVKSVVYVQNHPKKPE